MTSMLSTVMKSGRAAIVAVTLGAATVTALPVQAQSFSFDFGIRGGGNTFSFGFDDGRRFRRDCLTNNEIRRGLRRNGFDDIRFLDRRGVRVQVYAEWGRRAYILTINRCTGRVVDVDRVRRRGGGGDGPRFELELRGGSGGGGMGY